MGYYETTNYGAGDKRQCSRCGDDLPAGVPYMQSYDNALDSVCMDCYKGRKKPKPIQNSEPSGEGEVTERRQGFWGRTLGIVPKEKVITVEQQRAQSGMEPSKTMEEPTKSLPHTSTIPYSFDLSEELDSIERECDDAEQQGIGMRKVVERLRLKLGIPSRASKKQKEALRG